MREKQLLIVDDAPLIVSRIRTMLDRMPGLSPIFFSGTYAGAIEILQHHKPDIILLDINLPDRNGIDLLRYIRLEHLAAIVIMCSNQSSPYYRSLCSRLGAGHFIDKSTEFEIIPAIITQLLDMP
jgi:DNA-binding NarL/FixJ family response regulator